MPDWGDPLCHGGNLTQAAQHYARPLAEWLDLSSAVSPWAYPAPIDVDVLRSLPAGMDALEAAACVYYGAGRARAVAGTQFAIQAIPTRCAPDVVAVPRVGYREHARCWRAAGHAVFEYEDQTQLLAAVKSGAVRHAVVINPNNPSGAHWPREALLVLARELSIRNGQLVVDEAFADSQPIDSVADYAEEAGFWVLRSFGKFFGLPGLRLGFVLAGIDHLQQIDELRGPWPINALAVSLGLQALNDRGWQTAQRTRITAAEQRMLTLLRGYLPPGLEVVSGALFCTVTGEATRIYTLHEMFAQQGVWLRWYRFGDEGYLRFGLPGTEAGWRYLVQVLQTFR